MTDSGALVTGLSEDELAGTKPVMVLALQCDLTELLAQLLIVS